jgi:hypothetical protein
MIFKSQQSPKNDTNKQPKTSKWLWLTTTCEVESHTYLTLERLANRLQLCEINTMREMRL